MITLPCFIKGQSEGIERLIFKFSNARRRAYSMKQKGVDRLEIIRTLRRETGLHTRYVWTAYDMIKDLPPHVTFGGFELQRLRERSKISKAEFHMRRNNILACLGQASKGNLCLRVEDGLLRITVGPREWIHLPILIPHRYEGYRKYLDGSKPYAVLIKRKDDRSGYDVRVTVKPDELEIPEPKRVMALDLNAGHMDFAVVEKSDLKLMAVGKVNCHELLGSNQGKNKLVIHKVVNKIRNVARHYGAEVVAGAQNSAFQLKPCKPQNLPDVPVQAQAGHEVQALLSGVRYRERSEALTSKIGRNLSRPLGLDIHKSSAYAFAMKVIDYPTFKLLSGVRANEGDGSLSTRLSGGSGLTALRQQALVRDEALLPEATPRYMVEAGRLSPL